MHMTIENTISNKVRALITDLHKVLQVGVRIRFDFSNQALIADEKIIYYRIFRASGKPSIFMIGVPIEKRGLKINYDSNR